ESEGAAGGGADLPLRREPDSRRHGGREGGGETAVQFFAGGDGQRKALDGAEIGRSVGGSAAARMFTEIIAGNGFVQPLHAVVERGGGGHLFAAPDRHLVGFVG